MSLAKYKENDKVSFSYNGYWLEGIIEGIDTDPNERDPELEIEYTINVPIFDDVVQVVESDIIGNCPSAGKQAI